MSADADLLCRAEKLMRERAEAVNARLPAPWEAPYNDVLDARDNYVAEAYEDAEDYIASWHPTVTLAVADLLRVVDEAPSVPQHAVIVSALDCREVLARIRIAVDVIARVYLREVES